MATYHIEKSDRFNETPELDRAFRDIRAALESRLGKPDLSGKSEALYFPICQQGIDYTGKIRLASHDRRGIDSDCEADVCLGVTPYIGTIDIDADRLAESLIAEAKQKITENYGE